MTDTMMPPQEACRRFLEQELAWRTAHPLQLNTPLPSLRGPHCSYVWPIIPHEHTLPSLLRGILQAYKRHGWKRSYRIPHVILNDLTRYHRERSIFTLSVTVLIMSNVSEKDMEHPVHLLESIRYWVRHEDDKGIAIHDPDLRARGTVVLNDQLTEWITVLRRRAHLP